MEGNGADAVWTKIDEVGLDGTSWGVDKLIANKGKQDFTIPSGLKAGKYMGKPSSRFFVSKSWSVLVNVPNNTVRQEIIALHEADTTYDVNPGRGAQFYMSCVQFDISGNGSTVPSEKFAFNGGYSYADPGIKFNLYGGSTTAYTVPGPAIDPQLSGAAQKRRMRFERRS